MRQKPAPDANNFLFSSTSRANTVKHAAKAGPLCSQCVKLAIFRVGAKGYCRDHKAQAVVHARDAASHRRESSEWREYD